jgi:hypothetical protein
VWVFWPNAISTNARLDADVEHVGHQSATAEDGIGWPAARATPLSPQR